MALSRQFYVAQDEKILSYSVLVRSTDAFFRDLFSDVFVVCKLVYYTSNKKSVLGHNRRDHQDFQSASQSI